LVETNGHPEGVLHAWAPIAGGYSVELGIPIANLGRASLEGGKLGFDVANDDDATGAGRSGQTVWAGTAQNWADLSKVGDLSFVSFATDP
jgi:hypothetical protein